MLGVFWEYCGDQASHPVKKMHAGGFARHVSC